jgi:hypothetical protein
VTDDHNLYSVLNIKTGNRTVFSRRYENLRSGLGDGFGQWQHLPAFCSSSSLRNVWHPLARLQMRHVIHTHTHTHTYHFLVSALTRLWTAALSAGTRKQTHSTLTRMIADTRSWPSIADDVPYVECDSRDLTGDVQTSSSWVKVTLPQYTNSEQNNSEFGTPNRYSSPNAALLVNVVYSSLWTVYISWREEVCVSYTVGVGGWRPAVGEGMTWPARRRAC